MVKRFLFLLLPHLVVACFVHFWLLYLHADCQDIDVLLIQIDPSLNFHGKEIT